jgi:hypothetical protein|tara:strand:- start:4205 stop:4657 length:453 start_codon:yes stop_codon:yes gene_type:complete
MKRPLILVLSLLVLGVIFFVYTSFNKKHTDVATADVLQELSARELFASFDASEEEATQKYAEQVITVSGLLLHRDLSNDQEPQIILEGNGDDGFIRCGFKEEYLQNAMDLTDGDEVKVKGLCKGFNDAGDLDLLADRDVVLSNCILIALD